jgi:hypothetical protein
MAKQKNQVAIIDGSTDILIIAPHGVKGKGVRKDTNTDILARLVAKELGCSAIINDSIKRSECDYNRISEATKDKRFITAIRKVLDADGPTLVVWIHGMGEVNKEKERVKMKLKGALDCVIGYGQPNKTSARKITIDELSGLFRDKSITALPSADTGYFRAHESDNMNQWFRKQKEYSDLNRVQSVQLEFSMHLTAIFARSDFDPCSGQQITSKIENDMISIGSQPTVFVDLI